MLQAQWQQVKPHPVRVQVVVQVQVLLVQVLAQQVQAQVLLLRVVSVLQALLVLLLLPLWVLPLLHQTMTTAQQPLSALSNKRQYFEWLQMHIAAIFY
ncbi:hypothetical protein [Salinivibrio sp. MA427]|uniref:hypothetical protein n=1 Tax=Salinivibrio sp. MA427 TaxID=1909455 RepID=UPI0018FF0B78|nr:hypothetical protein [Salinivibrio sp. MA427]